MNIVFLNRFFYPDHSATSQILADLAFHLASRGATVHVITSRLSYEDPGARLAPFEQLRGVNIWRVATTRFGRDKLLGRAFDYLSFHVSAAWRAWRLVRREDVLIAKTDPPLISVVAMCVARLRGARLINWLQDIFPEVAAALGVDVTQRWVGILASLRDLSLHTAQFNVVLGDRMAQVLLRRGIARDHVIVIHNWADDTAIRPVAPANNRLLDEWGLLTKFVVGYSGNLGRAHEFLTILDTAQLLRNHSEIVFLFVGSGAQSEALKQEVVNRGLRNFIFRPYQPREHLSWSLSVADLHLVTLRPNMEGLIVPSKFYGIAAAGRPVAFIGDQDGEIARILRRHDCGRSFPMGDSSALAAYIQTLAVDRTMGARLGANARAGLDANYSQAMAFEAWEHILFPAPEQFNRF